MSVMSEHFWMCCFFGLLVTYVVTLVRHWRLAKRINQMCVDARNTIRMLGESRDRFRDFLAVAVAKIEKLQDKIKNKGENDESRD